MIRCLFAIFLWVRDAHLTVIAPDGEVREFALAGDTDRDFSYAIAAAPDGSLVLSGAFRKATRFGEHRLEAKKSNAFFVARRRP